MKRAVVLMAVCLLSLGFILPAAAAERVIADFNMPPPNNVGGACGAFTPSAAETTYVTAETIDENIKHGDAGASLRLDYNVGTAGAFNGFWMKLGPSDTGNAFDGTQYSMLSLWIKGDPKIGIPKSIKVELKGDPGTAVGRQYVKSITGDWKKIQLPLSKYSDQRVNMTKLNEFVIVFENSEVGPATEGRIWIDDIMLE
ncbi:MAG: hypothetical protein JXB04_12085 [Kiritimatiellae bacterium]|nr:hypothetical protein [Kiritimatiellia bacterium]